MKKVNISIKEWTLIGLILLSVSIALFVSIGVVRQFNQYNQIIARQRIEIACYRDYFENCKDQLGVFYNPKEMYAKGE